MKSLHLLFFAAITLIGFTSLPAQAQEESRPIKSITASPSGGVVVLFENTENLPGPEANVKPDTEALSQQSLKTGAAGNQGQTSSSSGTPVPTSSVPQTCPACPPCPTLPPTAPLYTRSARMYDGEDHYIYGQLGFQMQRLDGLNRMLASKYFPAVGEGSFRAEVGILHNFFESWSADIGLRYEFMNHTKRNERANRPLTGLQTELRSNMWLVGIQGGFDHSVFHDTRWLLYAGVGLGVDYGGLRLKENVREYVPSPPEIPTISNLDQQGSLYYHIVNLRVEPRITLRSPENSSGKQFHIRAGYQIGDNTLFRVNQFSSIRHTDIYKPAGFNISFGFTAQLAKVFCEWDHWQRRPLTP